MRSPAPDTTGGWAPRRDNEEVHARGVTGAGDDVAIPRRGSEDYDHRGTPPLFTSGSWLTTGPHAQLNSYPEESCRPVPGPDRTEVGIGVEGLCVISCARLSHAGRPSHSYVASRAIRDTGDVLTIMTREPEAVFAGRQH
jgi:hypothetical protein